MERDLFRSLVIKIVNFRLIPQGFDGRKKLDEMLTIKPNITAVEVYSAHKEPNTVERQAIEFLEGKGVYEDIVNFEDI